MKAHVLLNEVDDFCLFCYRVQLVNGANIVHGAKTRQLINTNKSTREQKNCTSELHKQPIKLETDLMS